MQSRVFTLALVVSLVAVLYLAKAVLVPFALAILLSFLLAPLVTRLEHWRLGRIPSVVIIVSLAFVLIGMVIWVVADQVVDLAENLPSYKSRIVAKVKAVSSSESGTVARVRATIDELMAELSDPREVVRGQTDRAAAEDEAPVPVEVVQPASSSLAFFGTLLTPVLGALATAGIVILFVFFMLIEREDLRNRLIRLIGLSQLTVTTQALDEAAYRVSRYLLMQLIVNATYGLTLAVGLYLIGIPNAVLWGFLAGVLRYIPYVGPWIAAFFPVALSLAAFDTWREPLLTIGLVIVLELLSNNIMEPWLYGSSTGISTIGIVVAAVFWTWLWGAIGLVLATPLTVCIAVIGRYVPQFEFFNILLSDEPVLTPGAQYYQRLLAGDQEEASELVEKYLEQHSVEECYDTILLPALELAEQDRHRGTLDDPKQAFIHDTIRELLDDLADRHLTHALHEATNGDGSEPRSTLPRRRILCLPARDDADEIAGIMLSQLLEARGCFAPHASVKALASEMLELVAQQGAGTVFVSAVPPFAVAHARYLCKRLRSRFPELRIIVGLWSVTPSGKKGEERLRAGDADKVVTTLLQALDAICPVTPPQSQPSSHALTH